MAATATRLNNRIRHWRRERGLSQEALGLKVGLSKATISKLERGGLHLRDVTIARLVAALDVPAGELLGDFAVGAPSRDAVGAPSRDAVGAPSRDAVGGLSREPAGAPSREPAEPEPTPDADSQATHFGFRAVDWGEKAGLVREVFDSVASRYDLMNDLMSGGVHRLWKAEMVTWLRPRPGMTVLDVAGGTGDVAYRIHERIHERADERAGGEEEDGRLIVCDINRAMLAAGRDRSLDRGIAHGIDWLCGDAEALPVADASVDAYTIAFGIRNVTRLDRALAEARRVLRPGGRFLCLEFGRVVVPGLASLYDAYSFRVLPALGALVARDRDAYRYLVESIRRFPDQARFSEMIAEAGFGARRHRNLAGGIAVLYSAWRV